MNGGNGGSAKERLTRELICEVALEVIDETGLESFSMRTLASALGVKASSLYYHFESKEQLLTGVAEFLYRRLGRPPSMGEWTEQVKGTFIQLREFIQAHPNAAPLLVRDLAYSPVAKKRANVLLNIVSRAGLDLTTSASLISNLVALLVGHTYLALWVWEASGVVAEAGTAGGGEGVQFDADFDGSRPWVYRLFPAMAVSPDGGREAVLVDGRSEKTRAKTAEDAPVVGRGTESETSSSPGPETDPPDDLAFLAGLNALIRGFAPD